MPSWLSLGFQDSSSMGMGELISFHDYVMTIMFSIVVMILYVMLFIVFSSKYYKHFSEGTLIETVWSIVPAFILVLLVLPSMKVLYMVEDIKFPSFTFKVVAHQWYWTYVYSFFNGFSFFLGDSLFSSFENDSVMVDSFGPGVSGMSTPRLMGGSMDFFVPAFFTSRMLISSTDVIHSFSVPSLGLKVDAFPGRTNQLFCSPSRIGFFFGQCSEICGSNHSFMPIGVKVCGVKDFDSFLFSSTLNFIFSD